VLGDLIVMLADGGDCLSDLRLLAGAEPLVGPLALVPTAWRVVEQVALVGEDGLAGIRAGIRAARAQARAVAWRAGATRRAGGSWTWILDLDATLITAHTDRKQGAAPTYKHGFGFHQAWVRVPPSMGSGSTRWAASWT